MNTAWEQQQGKKKVWGQTSFESPICSCIFLSSLKYRAQRQNFSTLSRKSNSNNSGRRDEGEKMEIEGLMNGDWQEIERDRESRMRDGQLGHSDRAVDWFGTSCRSLCGSKPLSILLSQTIHLLWWTILFLKEKTRMEKKARQKNIR